MEHIQCIVNELTQSIRNVMYFSHKPDDVVVSTMTLTCKFNCIFNCNNIAANVSLDKEAVVGVKYSRSKSFSIHRTLVQQKSRKVIHRGFYNQVSMSIYVNNKDTPVSVKLFSNGSVQMTGCHIIEHAKQALYKTLTSLYDITITHPEVGVISIDTSSNFNDIVVVSGFKVALINCMFKMPFEIDRPKLFNLSLLNNFVCYFEPMKHAAVNIKYKCNNKNVTLFVFEKGTVIITSVVDFKEVKKAYTFINTFLLSNYNAIKKIITI